MLLSLEINVKYIQLVPLAPQLKPKLRPTCFDGCVITGRLMARQLFNALLAMQKHLNLFRNGYFSTHLTEPYYYN
jgi:hypothetical protein